MPTLLHKNIAALAVLGFALSACDVAQIQQHLPVIPESWNSAPAPAKTPEKAAAIQQTTVLSNWWKQFHDAQLDWLVDQSLKENPDVHQASARIDEARGMAKTSNAALYPQITANGDAARERQLFLGPVTGNVYDASFDASYELDLFGKNREAAKAAELEAQAAGKDYDWVKLSLIAEVARNYVTMRAAEKQISLAEKNLNIEKDTLSLVDRQRKAGGASSFDYERAALQVNQSAARIAEYKRQRENATLALITLTGLDAKTLHQHLKAAHDIPGISLKAVADAPASVLARRPDIAAANARFTEATSLKESQAAAVFPTISLSGLFGLSKTLIVDTANVWSLGGNAAVSLLDFGRIQGQIDAASAREVSAYEDWRKAILQGMQDVETALTNVTQLSQQRVALGRAKENAAKAVSLAQDRYRAGDASLLDVLDAQRQLIDADSALIDAEGNYVTAIVALYKALGQY